MIGLAFAFSVDAQSIGNPTAVTPDATIIGETYKVITLDTLVDATNTSYVLRVKTPKERLTFRVALYTDRLSGTAGGKLFVYGSMDGTNYNKLDSITISGVASDVMDTEILTLSAYSLPYMKLTMTQTGTASCIHKPYIYAKY